MTSFLTRTTLFSLTFFASAPAWAVTDCSGLPTADYLECLNDASIAAQFDAEAVWSWIALLQDDLATAQAERDALQADLDLIQTYVQIDPAENTVSFVGANVLVLSGSGATNDNGSLTGLGNLIVGYAEDAGTVEVRTGSHNLVVGEEGSWSSYGGAVFGNQNEISAPFATVVGGYNGVASGESAVVSGGSSNDADHIYASVSGGRNNTASGYAASISGGYSGVASNSYSSISGGYDGDATGLYSAISGGFRNDATGYYSAVSGGGYNVAAGTGSAISGGKYNDTYSMYSTISGGYSNYTNGSYSAIAGGYSSGTGGSYSAVTGGANSYASGTYQVIVP